MWYSERLYRVSNIKFVLLAEETISSLHRTCTEAAVAYPALNRACCTSLCRLKAVNGVLDRKSSSLGLLERWGRGDVSVAAAEVPWIRRTCRIGRHIRLLDLNVARMSAFMGVSSIDPTELKCSIYVIRRRA